MSEFELLEKNSDVREVSGVVGNIFIPFATKKVFLKDEPLSIMLKDSSGKIDPFYLSYNVYLTNNDKYEVHFSKSMKFRKEIYYQLFLYIFSDVYSREKYIDGGSALLSELSYVFKNANYDLFKLVPVTKARNTRDCWNKRIMTARIGNYDYYACNFVWCEKNPKRRKSFLMWREKVVL